MVLARVDYLTLLSLLEFCTATEQTSSLAEAALTPSSFHTGCWSSLSFGETRASSWHSRMPPCPPQQNRNRLSQLPVGELGEMELTWQEIMSITELQVSMGWALQKQRVEGDNEEFGVGCEGKDLARGVGSCPAALFTFYALFSAPLFSFSSHLICLSSSTAHLPSLSPLTLSNELFSSR